MIISVIAILSSDIRKPQFPETDLSIRTRPPFLHRSRSPSPSTPRIQSKHPSRGSRENRSVSHSPPRCHPPIDRPTYQHLQRKNILEHPPSTQNAGFPLISACVTHIAQVSSPLPHPNAPRTTDDEEVSRRQEEMVLWLLHSDTQEVGAQDVY